jgi:hypothetical protein
VNAAKLRVIVRAQADFIFGLNALKLSAEERSKLHDAAVKNSLVDGEIDFIGASRYIDRFTVNNRIALGARMARAARRAKP